MSEPAPVDDSPWYCVRTRPRCEHLAAQRLEGIDGLEAYCPRIRYRKSTRRGPVWFVEALFPTYLFARFDFAINLKNVLYTSDVRGLVRFGDRYADVPAAAVRELKARTPADDIHIFEDMLEPGNEVEVLRGPFQGLLVTVTRVLPARHRVRILLDFLGRPTEAEVSPDELQKPGFNPRTVFSRHEAAKNETPPAEDRRP